MKANLGTGKVASALGSWRNWSVAGCGLTTAREPYLTLIWKPATNDTCAAAAGATANGAAGTTANGAVVQATKNSNTAKNETGDYGICKHAL